MVARIALIVAALVLGAWFALTLRGIWLQEDARALIPPPPAEPAPGAPADAEELLREAELLNPDIRPEFARGYLFALTGEHEKAAAVFEEIVRREPENARAYAALQAELRRFDPEAADRARERLLELAPPVEPE